MAASPAPPRDWARDDYALCIIGAGAAGLNALFVATRYLDKRDRVLLVDRKPALGGMWTDTYDYVRLHQPHPMFTAGNLRWQLERPPEYLATRPEILAHFERCLAELRTRVDLVTLYGWQYEAHRELQQAGAWQVEIELESCNTPGHKETIRARRCIKAVGFRIEATEPLELSSRQVESLSPHDLHVSGSDTDASKPVYIIGGGKTGMDTAHMLVSRENPPPVHLLVGRGTMFLSRDRMFPSGIKRYFKGTTTLRQAMDIADRFDGDNVADVCDFFRRHYAHSLGSDFEYHALGIISRAEHERIRDGVTSIVRDYLEDVTDTEAGPCMRMRSGDKQRVEPGSRIVNCTGYVMRDLFPYEPYVSEHGAVVSVQPTSSIHILTTFGAYFLTHLLYRDRLLDTPLYALDHQALINTDKAAFPYAAMVHILYNIMLIIDACSMSIMGECGLDFDRWHPWYRRMAAGLQLSRGKTHYAARCHAALERLRERCGLDCGPLPHVLESAAAQPKLGRRA